MSYRLMIKGNIYLKMQMPSLSPPFMLMVIQVHFHSPQNNCGALQENTIAEFS